MTGVIQERTELLMGYNWGVYSRQPLTMKDRMVAMFVGWSIAM